MTLLCIGLLFTSTACGGPSAVENRPSSVEQDPSTIEEGSSLIKPGLWRVEMKQDLIMHLPEDRILNLPQQPRDGSICVSDKETAVDFIKRIASEGNDCELKSATETVDEILLNLSCSVEGGVVESETRYVIKSNGQEIEGTSDVNGEVNGFKVTGTAAYAQIWEKPDCNEDDE